MIVSYLQHCITCCFLVAALGIFYDSQADKLQSQVGASKDSMIINLLLQRQGEEFMKVIRDICDKQVGFNTKNCLSLKETLLHLLSIQNFLLSALVVPCIKDWNTDCVAGNRDQITLLISNDINQLMLSICHQ